MQTKSRKSFFDMTHAEKEAEVARLARGTDYKETRPLSAKEKALWEAARRGRGRPPKAPGAKSVAVQVTFEPRLLQKIDHYAHSKKMSRSQLLARGAKLAMQG
jgi:hypothetical protein